MQANSLIPQNQVNLVIYPDQDLQPNVSSQTSAIQQVKDMALQLRRELDEKRQEVQIKDHQITHLTQERKELKNHITGLTQEKEELKNQNEQFQNQVTDLVRQLLSTEHNSNQEKEELRNQNELLRNQNELLRNQNELLRNQREESQNRVTDLVRQLLSAQHTSNQEKEELRNQNELLRNQNELLRNQKKSPKIE